ncbi:MAG: hypothetical protein ACOYNS_16680 [Bacteroidota bacterium]
MRIFPFIILVLLLTSCDKESDTLVQQQPQSLVKDSVIALPINFITTDYIELNKIERISKFRSGIGHDYRDDAESCRSMKHYYQPLGNISWSSVKIFSPVTGKVVRTFEEWAGTQLWIQPSKYPAYTIMIFHINLLKPLAVGDSVTAGMQIGTHIGSQTMSDIAVGYSIGNKWQLLSYFTLMSDSLFSSYAARGITSRNELIITKAARDADPLNCSGETFGTGGSLENWVLLK